MNDLPIRFEWETCVGAIQEDVETHELLPPGKYRISIDTFNGDSLVRYMTEELEVLSSYLMKGGHWVSNAIFCGKEVIVSEVSFAKRVVIYNYPHHFRWTGYEAHPDD